MNTVILTYYLLHPPICNGCQVRFRVVFVSAPTVAPLLVSRGGTLKWKLLGGVEFDHLVSFQQMP